jgi:DNA primase
MFNTFESNNLNVLNSNILYSIISPDEIFRRYLLYVPMDNTKIKCIFHKERTPSLLFKNNKFRCFGCGKSGDAIALVMYLFNLDYKSAVHKIYSDFKLNLSDVKPINKELIINQQNLKKISIFTHEKRNFNLIDKNYWESYEITKNDLILYNIFPVSYVKINNNILWVELKDNPIYHLPCWDEIENKVRYYRPMNTEEFNRDKSKKWIGNTNYNSIFGYNELLNFYDKKILKNNILFITSSLKDVVTLYKSGYYSIAPTAETNFINDKILNELKQQFKYIYVFFNNDEAGKLNSIKYTQKYNLNYINLPDKFLIDKVKDPSDMIKKINRNELNNVINEKLKRDGVE